MSGVFRTIDPPPPHRPASVYPPSLVRGGGHIRWVERGWGVNSSEDAGHCSVLYICKYFVRRRQGINQLAICTSGLIFTIEALFSVCKRHLFKVKLIQIGAWVFQRTVTFYKCLKRVKFIIIMLSQYCISALFYISVYSTAGELVLIGILNWCYFGVLPPPRPRFKYIIFHVL